VSTVSSFMETYNPKFDMKIQHSIKGYNLYDTYSLSTLVQGVLMNLM